MMKKKNKLKLIPALLVAAVFTLMASFPYGCSNSPFDGLKQGKVIYDVSFEGEDIPAMYKAMLPSEVTTYFGDNKTCMVISIGMSIMELKFVSDASKFNYVAMFSGPGKRVAMVLNKEQVKENYLDRVNLKIVQTGEEKEIAGIMCKQAMVTDSTNNTYPVYYTEELAIEKPNWSSPFREINGLLMEFSINVAGMRMNLKAKEIINEVQDPAFFDIPEGYEIIHDAKDLGFGI